MADLIHLSLQSGRPWPLGASCTGTGVNFAVWAPDATAVELCLFDDDGCVEQARLSLPACSEGVWHGFLPGGRPGIVYGLRAHGPWAPQQGHRFNPAKLLLDPWAHEVVGRYGRQAPGPVDDPQQAAALAAELALHVGSSPDDPNRPDPRDNAATALKARVPAPEHRRPRPRRPRVPPELTVLYEAHVRGMTNLNKDVPPQIRGTYAGLAHPSVIEYLKKLGITALELMPIHQFVNDSFLQEKGLSNYWGYNTIGFFAPHNAYSSSGQRGEQVNEFKSMVKAYHRAGMEVILDVVYNHTAEGNHLGPTFSLRGIDNAAYYRLTHDNPRFYMDYTGTGNTLNMMHPHVLQLIMEADVDGLIGAGRHERSSERATWRNGYRDRSLDTRVGTLNLKIPKLRAGSYFPGFLEPRKMVEKALVAVIQEAWIGGVSTRRVDELVQAMGMTGISKSSVSKLCKDIDERVNAFLKRPGEVVVSIGPAIDTQGLPPDEINRRAEAWVEGEMHRLFPHHYKHRHHPRETSAA